MKETMKKISAVLKTIFGYGIMICLFSGGLTFFGYIAAMIIGGETATEMCVYIYKTYFPFVIQVCSVCVGCGLVGMYMNKVVALTFAGDNKSKK